MTNLWDDLLGCLDLLELPSARPARRRSSRAGRREIPGQGYQQLSYHRLFGGQLLAQFVRAASLTSPGKTVKSLHVLFPREGRSQEPVRYEVERHHRGQYLRGPDHPRPAGEGRHRHRFGVHARPRGRAQPAGIDPVPAVPGAEHRVNWACFPGRPVGADLDARESAPPEFSLWMRTPPVSPALAAALTAYATDLTLIGTAVRPLEGVSQRDAQHGVHVRRHLAHPVVPPAVPHRRLAAAPPAQPDPGARPLLRPGRRPHRGRLPGRLLRPGSPPPLPAGDRVRAASQSACVRSKRPATGRGPR